MENPQEITKKVHEWFDNKKLKDYCTSCEKPHISKIVDEFTLISNSEKTKFNFIIFICKNCGHTKLYHLDTILSRPQV
jgi:RNase P subunit RPR2